MPSTSADRASDATPRARLAAPGDLALLRSLHAAACREVEGRRGGEELAACLPTLEELEASVGPAGAPPARPVLLGHLDGAVAGLASATRPAPRGARRRPAPSALLDLLYVAPEARRRGLATALVEAVVRWAGDAGCVGIDVPALPGDRALKSLLEANGLRARLLVLHRPLEPPVR